MKKRDLRDTFLYPEVDYIQLKDALKAYHNFRAKITDLINKNEITRIKKGIYVVNRTSQGLSPNINILANMIYGPSVISLEYALNHYGLIPERVVEVTSVTPNRNKLFETPLGRFSYRYLNQKAYSVGIQFEETTDGRQFAIACPEKALVDTVALTKKLVLTKKNVEEYLFDDLRLDDALFSNLNHEIFKSLVEAYEKPNIAVIYEYLARKTK